MFMTVDREVELQRLNTALGEIKKAYYSVPTPAGEFFGWTEPWLVWDRENEMLEEAWRDLAYEIQIMERKVR
jgi:hypothetical protein